MKRLIAMAMAVVLLLGLCAIPVMAAKGDTPANDKEGGVGESDNAFLYLYEKDADWEIVWDGAWGKMQFNLRGSTFDFVFNGKGLTAGEDYTLIYYGDETHNDQWPYATCIASGTANNGGNIHLAGSHDFGYDLANAKIWLITSDDVNCNEGTMTGWHPTEYLFEHNVISYDDTDV